VVLPAVLYGGITILTMIVGDPSYMATPTRQDLRRAGSAHAGVLPRAGARIASPRGASETTLEPAVT
jgi:hypothetical protein